MSEDNDTNLPILDDIILPGKAGKAPAHAEDRTPHPDQDREPTDESSPQVHTAATDTTMNVAPVDAAAAQAVIQPDIDALTEAVLASVRSEIDQLLRQKIRQVLAKHLAGDSDSA